MSFVKKFIDWFLWFIFPMTQKELDDFELKHFGKIDKEED